MRLRLFWKLGLTYLLLLAAAVAAIDVYASQILRREYVRGGFGRLEALAALARAHPPKFDDPEQAQIWVTWVARGHVRATLMASDGQVLADSEEDPRQMDNHSNRPEVQAALREGEGRSVRFSHTVRRELLYLAIRYDREGATPIVLRLAYTLAELEEAVAEVRTKLWLASLLVVGLAGGVSLAYSRAFSRRVERLKEFSRRVAKGDFRPLPVGRQPDELSDLNTTMNETAQRLEQTVASLREERDRSAAILRSMVEGVAVVDADERVLFCNEGFCRALTLASNVCEGRPLLEVVRHPQLVSVMREALAGRESAATEITLGTVRTRSFTATAAPIRSDQHAGAVLVLHDISEIRRLERVRQDFVANVSHEFKTPLTAIQGFAETLLGGALEDGEHGRRFLGIIRDHAGRLARLTDDLLKLARMDAGKLEIRNEPVRAEELVEACVETSRLRAEQRGLQLTAQVADGLPAVRGDVGRLQELLQNLVDNALNYTPAGGRVMLKAERAGDEVVFSVRDTGIGIPEGEQGRIFERFYRVDASRTREAGGTGLGLAIARHLAEAHGGRLWVESEVGAGSTFYVALPAWP